jgi:hypothetical protein
VAHQRAPLLRHATPAQARVVAQQCAPLLRHATQAQARVAFKAHTTSNCYAPASAALFLTITMRLLLSAIASELGPWGC